MLRLISSVHSTLEGLRPKALRLLRATDGATAIEYGLIAAGIAVAIIAAVFALGTDLQNFFTGISKQMQTKMP